MRPRPSPHGSPPIGWGRYILGTAEFSHSEAFSTYPRERLKVRLPCASVGRRPGVARAVGLGDP